MYAVVLFKISNEVELVPSNWLEHSKLSVLWPPFRSATASKAVKERLKPDPSTWKSYEIRVLRMCKTYEEGRQKLKTAEDTSDIQTEPDVQGGKRRRKQPTAWSSSENESDSEVPVQKSTKTSRSSSSAQRATFPSAPVVPNLPNLRVPQFSTDVVDVDDDVHTQDSLHDDSQTSSSGIHKSHISTGVTAKDMTILKALSEVQVALAVLKDEVTSQRKVLSAMSGKMRRSVEIDCKLPQNVTLPLEKEEDVEKIEQSLKDAEAMTAFVNHLQLIGGDTIKECVKRYMGEVLHHQLALTYNWAGKSGWKGDGVAKRAFGGLKICAAVTQAVVKNSNLDTTSKAVEREVMCWLRNAGDRYGGRKRRQLLKLQKEDEGHQSDDD